MPSKFAVNTGFIEENLPECQKVVLPRHCSAMSRTCYCLSNMDFEARMGLPLLCKYCFFSECFFDVTEPTKGKKLLINL